MQRLTKMMSSAFNNVPSFLMIADPDTVEEKNILPQPFIPSILGSRNPRLAKRYGGIYG
ncbi:hypothetical protein PUW24_09340 [Paenibacillus urinalis]|uniref:Uncharacterized protein n=1 Tax=Paenibacillus urinalis TaxID=521520 RepID=A0AAX3MZH5_9BACL|nr:MULTISPECIES: hypothetical protein [Paenibacillus]WDH83000.1 hypothetical protein PUW23_01785 [Paenibacillus urinalis]WDH99054.1 hypothetical protein PUW24_09340 [Paenibacillus urinalis]WDI02745.1 hypothetical protein PUW25_01790 [Paenibacillus urinalis]GAK40233.1 hypothetical protein TCA2_2723 [Paenibacillus sp. TCA20]